MQVLAKDKKEHIMKLKPLSVFYIYAIQNTYSTLTKSLLHQSLI